MLEHATRLACILVLAGAAAPGAQAGSFKKIHTFTATTDGMNPAAPLTAIGNTLYGTTVNGGAAGSGTVFSVDAATGAETVVYSFQGGNDGGFPEAGLVAMGGVLYGTTAYGGPGQCDATAPGCGTVFSLDPVSGTHKVMYSFKGGRDGQNPFAALTVMDGVLYGTTTYGGVSKCKQSSYGCGTVFAVNPATDAESIVYALRGTGAGTPDGAYPSGGLLAHGGTLYGVSQIGGASNDGTVFTIDPVSGAERVLASFTGANGAYPTATLMAEQGTLYGTTSGGGAGSCSGGCGTIFSVDPAAGTVSSVASFSSTRQGFLPMGGLIRYGAKLFGTTLAGGKREDGNIYSLDLRTGLLRSEHAFGGGVRGRDPLTSLIRVGNALYGTTPYGDQGTVFAYTP